MLVVVKMIKPILLSVLYVARHCTNRKHFPYILFCNPDNNQMSGNCNTYFRENEGQKGEQFSKITLVVNSRTRI